MARARVLAENVDVKYEYLGKKESVDGLLYDLYHVTISGIVDGVDVGVNTDVVGGEKVYSSASPEVKDGMLEFDSGVGEIVVDVYKLRCSSDTLNKMKIKLYGKNIYADDPACIKLKKYRLDVCDENYQGELDSAKFYETINPYLDKEKKDNIFSYKQFVEKYFLIFIVVGVVFLGLVIFLIYRYRKSCVLE